MKARDARAGEGKRKKPSSSLNLAPVTNAPTPLELALVAVTGLLLAASLPAFALAYRRLWREWSDAPTEADDRASRAMLAACVVGALFRFVIAEPRLATVFIGYRWTQQAIDLFPLPHYGAASALLHHLVFFVTPPHHDALMRLNAALGALTVPLVGTFAWRLFGHRFVGAIATLFAAAIPLFVRNDLSEANGVPSLWWLFGAGVLWQAFLREGRTRELAGAAVLAMLAALSRPEFLLLAPMALIGSAWAQRESSRLRDRRVIASMIVVLAAMSLQLVFVLNQADALQGRSSLPGLSWSRVADLPFLWSHVNVFTDGALFPLLLIPFALVLIVRRDLNGSRRAALFLLGMAIVAWLSVVVDLDRANVARVQVTSALMVSVLASAGLATVVERLRSERLKRPALLLFLVALTANAWPSWKALWQPTNEQAEEELIAEALEQLPERGATLVRWGRDDLDPALDPHGLTHHHFPDYLLRPPHRDLKARSYREQIAAGASGDTYVLLSYRCYAQLRRPSDAAPAAFVQPTCRELFERFKLAPVFEREAENRGDVWINYFPSAERLHVGLYRITGRN